MTKSRTCLSLFTMTVAVGVVGCGSAGDSATTYFSSEDPGVGSPGPVPALPAHLEQGGALPAYLTAEERTAVENGAQSLALHVTAPPSGNVSVPAEFASMDGVIVHIPMYSATQDFFGKMVHEISLSGATPYLLVEDNSEANAVETYFLTPYGTSRSSVRFIYTSNDAFWSRDFGPFFVYVNGARAIVDMQYYPTRPKDDYVPIAVGEAFDEDVYSAAFSTEGGNFMTDGLGTCWASTGIFRYNNLSESQARKVYRDYLGCQTTQFITPLPGEGTTHLDMFSKVVDANTILVAYSNASLGANSSQIAQLDAAAQAYASTPKPGGGSWKIVRIPMVIDNRNEVFNAYTNSLIVNNTVIVPTYSFGSDSEALQTYRDAMPSYRVVGVPAASVISMGGSVHCTTMQVPSDSAGSSASMCGDGDVNIGETCDRNSVPCASLGQGFTSGTATCNATCSGWDTGPCSGGSTETTLSASGTVAKDKYVIVEGNWLEASSGSFNVQMTGSGDADLYVWKDVSNPAWSNYTCRPFLDGSNESCDLSGPGQFLVAVRGYAASSSYNVSITYTP